MGISSMFTVIFMLSICWLLFSNVLDSSKEKEVAGKVEATPDEIAYAVVAEKTAASDGTGPLELRATFRLESGELLECELDTDQYGSLEEGDAGLLVFKSIKLGVPLLSNIDELLQAELEDEQDDSLAETEICKKFVSFERA